VAAYRRPTLSSVLESGGTPNSLGIAAAWVRRIDSLAATGTRCDGWLDVLYRVKERKHSRNAISVMEYVLANKIAGGRLPRFSEEAVSFRNEPANRNDELLGRLAPTTGLFQINLIVRHQPRRVRIAEEYQWLLEGKDLIPNC